MQTRREMIKLLAAAAAGAGAFFSRLGKGLQLVLAETKRLVLPKGTSMETLTGKNPAALDAGNLETTPLEEFGIMGQTNYSIAVEQWRLAIDGAVDRPLSLTYADLTSRPSLEREVLLICPGFFAYKGRWKGVSMTGLLAEAGQRPDAVRIAISGPEGVRGRSESFDLEEVRSDKIFLAYQVNGQPLPQKHGFPVRLVAEDHYGSRWVKYVDQITVQSG